MDSSCEAIKSISISIKKFYNLLSDKGVFKKFEYEILCETIKEDLPKWFEKMKLYDTIDGDEVFHYFGFL